jgi:hypothetical protein
MPDAAPIDILLGILELIRRIERQTIGIDREVFMAYPDMQDATAYRLLAIGEAFKDLGYTMTLHLSSRTRQGGVAAFHGVTGNGVGELKLVEPILFEAAPFHTTPEAQPNLLDDAFETGNGASSRAVSPWHGVARMDVAWPPPSRCR